MTKTRIPLVDLKAQFRSIERDMRTAMDRVLEQTSFILGPEVEAFEREFAAFCEVGHCVGCGNGTDAISLALEAVGVRAGDEVITVSHTFIASAEAITAIGAKPVFVDVRDDTMLIDASLIERAITPKTRAILPVHLYGQTADMDAILAVAHKHKLKVVEDAAQAHGARFRGKRAGSMGHAATFSFYPGKNLGAYGDAGAITTNDAAVAAWIAKARNHGRATKYEHDFEARNSRMDGMQGAVLRVKLAHLEKWNEQRKQLARAYDEMLRDKPGVRTPTTGPGCDPVFHLYVIRSPRRDAILERLKAEGIEAGIHYPVPLHLQKAYTHHNLKAGALPVTEKAAKEIVSLPLFPELSLDDARTIAKLVAEEAAR